jgi:hypothetical protein
MSISPETRHRRFFLTPDRFVSGLLVVVCLLWLSESLHLFATGWAVLTAAACVGMALLMMLLWLAASLFLRRRFQFSIRSLFVLVLSVAIPCGWLAVERERARRQSETVEWTKKLGGYVEYDWQDVINGNRLSATQPPGAALPRDLLGVDFFHAIILIDLGGTQVTDAGLEYLERLTQIHGLVLNRTQVTDAGLKHLKVLTRLQVLSLNYTQVTDAGLEHLEGLSQLQSLGLEGTKVTEDGLKKLRHALSNCVIYH